MAVGERRHDAVRKLARSPLGGVFEPERDCKPKFTGFCEFLSSLCPLAANVTPIEVLAARRDLPSPGRLAGGAGRSVTNR